MRWEQKSQVLGIVSKRYYERKGDERYKTMEKEKMEDAKKKKNPPQEIKQH